MSTSQPVQFFYESPVTLRDRTRLKKFIVRLFRAESRALESVNYIFVSDERLLEINRSYLQHDYYTDIITFDLAPPAMPVVGEIYISTERVRENASAHNTSLTEELHRVIFHGALHLCGYKDKSKGDKIRMTGKEDEWLRRYFKNR